MCVWANKWTRVFVCKLGIVEGKRFAANTAVRVWTDGSTFHSTISEYRPTVERVHQGMEAEADRSSKLEPLSIPSKNARKAALHKRAQKRRRAQKGRYIPP